MPTASSLTAGSGWRAELDLEFTVGGHRTVLSKRRHSGPLMVQRPFYPEGEVCHCYVIHPPGGIVGGDLLDIGVTAEPGAHVVMTTPAAAKFYRSDGRRAQLSQKIAVNDAVVEWLPQENIFFGDSQVRMQTRVQLRGNAKFLGWELACYGRPASGDTFAAGRVFQAFELWRDGLPLVLEQLRLDGSQSMMQARWGLAGYTVMGTLLAYPASEAEVQAVRSIEFASGLLTATLVDGVLVCRCVAHHTHLAKDTLVSVWKQLRPLMLGREAVLPRVWAT